ADHLQVPVGKRHNKFIGKAVAIGIKGAGVMHKRHAGASLIDGWDQQNGCVVTTEERVDKYFRLYIEAGVHRVIHIEHPLVPVGLAIADSIFSRTRVGVGYRIARGADIGTEIGSGCIGLFFDEYPFAVTELENIVLANSSSKQNGRSGIGVYCNGYGKSERLAVLTNHRDLACPKVRRPGLLDSGKA